MSQEPDNIVSSIAFPRIGYLSPDRFKIVFIITDKVKTKGGGRQVSVYRKEPNGSESSTRIFVIRGGMKENRLKRCLTGVKGGDRHSGGGGGFVVVCQR